MSRGQINLLDEIIVDNFAGGGGASTGIELATGRVVDIAINHDPDAILMHRTNHPHTMHYQASVWDVDPVEVCRGRPVGLAWFSPDCKHFSKASFWRTWRSSRPGDLFGGAIPSNQRPGRRSANGWVSWRPWAMW